MFNQSPQIEIQADTLQAIHDCKTNKTSNESIWIHINDEFFRLKVLPKLLIDSKNSITMVQKRHRSNEYNLKYKDFEISLVFPMSYHLFSIDKLPNFSCLKICSNSVVFGTENGSIVETTNPLSINISNPLIINKAHLADITKICMNRSNSILLTIGLDMQIKVWDNIRLVENHDKPNKILSNVHKARITDCLLYNKDNNIISSGLDGKIVIWDLSSGSSIWIGRRIKDLNDGCNCLSLYSNNPLKNEEGEEDDKKCANILWCGHQSGIVSVWDCNKKLNFGEFLTNEDNLPVEKIESVDETTVVVGLNNGNLLCFKYDILSKTTFKLWEANIEKLNKDENYVNLKQLKVYNDYVIALSDNYFVKLDVKTGKTLDIFVGYDEIINDFDIFHNQIIAAGKKCFVVCLNL